MVTAAAVTNRLVFPSALWAIPPSAGVQLSVVSTSAADAELGTGIRIIDIEYLDDELTEKREKVTLNGTTPVLTTATNIRFVQCVHMEEYGTGKKAAGDISLKNGGFDYGFIPTGGVRCGNSARMVPKGKRLFVSGAIGGSSSGAAAASTTLSLGTSVFDNRDYTDDSILIPIATVTIQDSSESYTFPVPIKFEEGSVVGLLATSDKVATITASWLGWIEDA
jgi:hypothetical protein